MGDDRVLRGRVVDAVPGANASRDAAQVGVNARLALTRAVALLGTFNGRFSGVETAIGGFAGLPNTW